MQVGREAVYLSAKEEEVSGFRNPIKLSEFDLHQERMAADQLVDFLYQLSAADGAELELTSAERAMIPKGLMTAEMRANIVHGIAKELAMRTIVFGDDPIQ